MKKVIHCAPYLLGLDKKEMSMLQASYTFVLNM